MSTTNTPICPNNCIRYAGKKSYPLQLDYTYELCDGWHGSSMNIFTKGHHDADVFLDEDEVQDFLRKLRENEREVQWDWWRCVPADGEGNYYYKQATPQSRGSFPVTFVGAVPG